MGKGETIKASTMQESESMPSALAPTSQHWEGFPHGPVAKILHSQCRGPRFDPWSGS